MKDQETHRNPEQDVLDDIDRLVTETMKAGRMRDYDDQGESTCPVCGSLWHGLPGGGKFGCPGEYGTDEEKAEYAKPVAARIDDAVQAGLTMAVRPWLDEDDVPDGFVELDDEIPVVRGDSAVATIFDEVHKWFNAEVGTPTLVFSRRNAEIYAAYCGMTVDQFCAAYNVVESPELPELPWR
jgi:hypothetical protein